MTCAEEPIHTRTACREHGLPLSTRRTDAFCHIARDVNDEIHIEGLEVLANIGVPEEERVAAQRLSFNLTLCPILEMSDLGDAIERTVNYAAVCAEVEKFAEPRRDKLIETMANALALHLLETFRIRRITIELRKYILPEVEFVSVTVTRERSKE
jgi:dihydroneopterin aldolase